MTNREEAYIQTWIPISYSPSRGPVSSPIMQVPACLDFRVVKMGTQKEKSGTPHKLPRYLSTLRAEALSLTKGVLGSHQPKCQQGACRLKCKVSPPDIVPLISEGHWGLPTSASWPGQTGFPEGNPGTQTLVHCLLCNTHLNFSFSGMEA